MSNALHDIIGAAGGLLDGGRSRTVRRMAGSTVHRSSRTVRRALSMLRRIDLEDVMVWLHLSRRRGPLGAIALLGAGAAVGAGLVLLLSPTSGPEVRRTLKRRAASLEERVEEQVSEALHTAREAVKSKPD